jgi:hypothetical protein
MSAMRFERLPAFMLAAYIFVSGGMTADAAQTLSTEVTASGSSPVRIDRCRAALLDQVGPGGIVSALVLTRRNAYVAGAVDFTDIDPQPLNAVRFLFDVQDTFGVVTESLGLDWLGTFSPGVMIHARQNLAGTVGAVGQANTASSPTNVICHVQFARFADGRVWKEGDRSAPVAPGLYYPTPYPSSSPKVTPTP